jgi:O-antigen/teichoic acid export membrane protein
MVAALFMVSVFVVLGVPLVNAWMGPGYEEAATWLAILALGQVLPFSQWVTHSMVLALGRQRIMACVGVVECTVAFSVALALREYGLFGMCVTFALCSTFCRGIVQLSYGCRLLRVPVTEYATQVLVLPALAAALPVGVLVALNHWRTPHGLVELIGVGGIFAATYGLSVVVVARWGANEDPAKAWEYPGFWRAWSTKVWAGAP